ncbi:MAG: adenylate/guanylate cyclase domain-containing protein [Thermoplasmata archaeon]
MASTRRLAAIMFTDTVGYTASTQANEGGTLDLLRQQAELVHPLVAVHQGREIKSTGDGFLVEFESALKATQCAVSIQRRIYERNSEGGLSPIRIRIGIHLGDVVGNGTDILGDAVNIAARIEPVAEPGGICISGAIFEQVRNKIPDKLEKLAPTALKGLQLPMDIYRVVLPWTVEGPGAADSTPVVLEKNRIAVLPFVSMSPDPNDEYFADGLTEELIASLALVKGLKVIARTSVMEYKKKEKHVSVIGKELGVVTVVEGSVRKAANRIRVTVQVIDVATEEHLWASKYDDNLDDIFAVQTDIATKVAASIPSNLALPSSKVPVLDKARETQAYLLYLQGQALMWKFEEEPLRQSKGFFEQAVERDPTFARAYAGLARSYIRLGSEAFMPWLEAIEKGKVAAARAGSINPDLAEAHSLLAELAFMADDPADVLDREVTRALELNPNLAEAHNVLGQLAGSLGNIELYVSQAEEAYQLDPLFPPTVSYLGRAYFFSGREDQAFAHWRRNVHLDPLNSYRGMAEYYMLKGDLDSADTMVRELERLAPESDYAYLNRGYLAALKGDRALALQMIERMESTSLKGRARNSSPGFIYLALGDLDKFFEYMFDAGKEHTLQMSRVRFSPLFAVARKDPRFLQLLSTYGRPGRSPT